MKWILRIEGVGPDSRNWHSDCNNIRKYHTDMKRNQLIATTLVTAALAGTAVYLVKRAQKKKRLAIVSNAGYEMAYDVHFPVKYKKTAG